MQLPRFLCVSHDNRILATVKLSPVSAIVMTYSINCDRQKHRWRIYNDVSVNSRCLVNLVIIQKEDSVTNFVYCSFSKLFVSRIRCN